MLKWITGILVAGLAIAFTVLPRLAQKPRVTGVQINVATICDSATNNNGKLSMQGTFDTIFAPSFPATHPRCSVALRLTFGADQMKRHPVRIRFLQSDGSPLLSDVLTHLEPKPPRPGTPIGALNLVINISELRLPAPGTSYAEVWIDDRLLTTLPFYAVVQSTHIAA